MVKNAFKPRYLLIDGHALIHRGYHAVPGLVAGKSGLPVGAVYGFTMILLRAIKDLHPTHIACAFDLDGPTFRHERYADYKGTRAKTPDDLVVQFDLVREVVRSLGIPIFEKPGFEADDVLGTLATTICEQEKNKVEVMIATGDLDSLQLVGECVKIYTLRKGINDTAVYDVQAIFDRFGLTPGQMVDYKALRGDPSDNIKGVRGIGGKTAAELVQKFGSLEGLYRAIKEGGDSLAVKPRILQLLIEGEAAARESYELSKIVTHVPLDGAIKPYAFGPGEAAQTAAVFQKFEFKSLLDKLPKGYGPDKALATNTPELSRPEAGQGAPSGQPIGKQKYVLIDTVIKLEELLTKLQKSKELVLDTESTSLDIVEALLVGVSVSIKQGEAYYVPAAVVQQSQRFLSFLTSDVRKVGHNIKFDAHMLRTADIELGSIWFDTMIAAYLLNAGTRQYSLDTLAFNEFGYHMQPIEDLIGKGKSQITMDKVAPEKVSWYAAEDADMTLRLKQAYEPRLKDAGLYEVFTDIEMPLIPVLARMERCGIKLDTAFVRTLSAEAEESIAVLEKEVYSLSGQAFNLNSPKQLKEVLFEKLGLSTEGNRKTKTGLSTAAGELEKLVGQHPVIEKILEYRELAKLQSTYLKALLEMVHQKTGRIHTSFNQTIAATGRLSSTDPNLQNIPVRDSGLGSKIRKAFVAEKGWRLLSIDYSQIELRMVAHLSQDEAMCEVFASGEDIHTSTAVGLFGVPADKVTKDMRRHAKTVNFGILYGLSAFGLSYRMAELDRIDAKEYIEKYFQTYPGVKAYIEQVKEKVRTDGFVTNELGRKRSFPEIKSSQFFIRQAAERAAVNFPIQSLAADVIKVAMINIGKELAHRDKEARMLLQVHDELVFEIREDKVAYYVKLLKPIMEQAVKLSVPVTCEAKVGNNWGEMERV